MTERECGSCFACCVHLGIEELKKWPGQSCKHLDAKSDPNKRCGIYANRPLACSSYHCGYIAGIGSIDSRPDKSGILLTTYAPNSPESGLFSVTATIIDPKKCGNLATGPMIDLIHELTSLGCHDIRFISQSTKKLVHVFNGKIYKGDIISSNKDDYEALNFATYEPPIGTYRKEPL